MGQAGADFGGLLKAIKFVFGNLDASGNLTSLANVTTRTLSLLTGRTADQLNFVGGGGRQRRKRGQSRYLFSVSVVTFAAFMAQAGGAGDYAAWTYSRLCRARADRRRRTSRPADPCPG